MLLFCVLYSLLICDDCTMNATYIRKQMLDRVSVDGIYNAKLYQILVVTSLMESITIGKL